MIWCHVAVCAQKRHRAGSLSTLHKMGKGRKTGVVKQKKRAIDAGKPERSSRARLRELKWILNGPVYARAVAGLKPLYEQMLATANVVPDCEAKANLLGMIDCLGSKLQLAGEELCTAAASFHAKIVECTHDHDPAKFMTKNEIESAAAWSAKYSGVTPPGRMYEVWEAPARDPTE